ncbi:Uncharacterised protein [Weissella viridescens]|uniref:Uncharacterized protein n=1 Tax=Weissella viridescens TaxID=1629 RepID=A0A380P3A2_WEIVI|nr:Uncharacterised protein [Weissella viridescens]
MIESKYAWQLVAPDDQLVKTLENDYQLPNLVAKYVVNQGLKTPEEIQAFCNQIWKLCMILQN